MVIPASIPLIIRNAPLLLIFALTATVVNLLITLIFGKLLKFSIEETVLALAIGKGWRDLLGLILPVGMPGYVIGNYVGMFVHSFLCCNNFQAA